MGSSDRCGAIGTDLWSFSVDGTWNLWMSVDILFIYYFQVNENDQFQVQTYKLC